MAKLTRDSITNLVGSKVEAFNNKHSLFSKNDFILIGCSGNADSVFAVHYLINQGYKIGIAHIDHQTRNGQSTKDAEFVEVLAKNFNVPFHLKVINVKEIISERGNFQEVARKERYLFFNNLVKKYNYSKLLTAHHADDNVENLLMNLGRAGGLKAMRGILPKNDFLIRPFLCLRKKEILSYLELNKIHYTIDSSNLESEYKRNYFRNEVLPIIQKKQNNWVDQCMKSMEFVLEIENEIKYLSDQLVEVKGELHSINIKNLFQKKNPSLYLSTILSTYNFNNVQVQEILKSTQVGKRWESADYILFKERQNLEFFNKKIIRKNLSYTIEQEIPGIGKIDFAWIKATSRKIVFPNNLKEEDLIVRIKQDGDYVQYQNSRKKLKKIFNDAKWTNFQKLTSRVIALESEIYWIENLKL